MTPSTQPSQLNCAVCEMILPWPSSVLSPNARTHWAALAKEKKAYRDACAWTASSQGAKRIYAKKLHLTITFYAPTRRAYDLDNALASIKSGLDGLADVLGVDDSKWSLTIAKGEGIGGMIKVVVCE